MPHPPLKELQAWFGGEPDCTYLEDIWLHPQSPRQVPEVMTALVGFATAVQIGDEHFVGDMVAEARKSLCSAWEALGIGEGAVAASIWAFLPPYSQVGGMVLSVFPDCICLSIEPSPAWTAAAALELAELLNAVTRAERDAVVHLTDLEEEVARQFRLLLQRCRPDGTEPHVAPW